MLLLLIDIFAFALIALVAGNNLSACSGAIISGRVVGRRIGIAIAALGYIIGLFAQGYMLKSGFSLLAPLGPGLPVLIALGTSIIIFAAAHLMRVPQSLSITLTMAILGSDIAYGEHFNAGYMAFVIEFWIAAATISLLAAFVSMEVMPNMLFRKRIWSSLAGIRAALVAASFFAAFTLGANTIGLVAATMGNVLYADALAVAAIIIGCFALGAGELKRVGQEIIPLRYANALVSQASSIILVEIATLFGIPLSNTQTFTAGVYGVGLSYRNRLMRVKPAATILSTWILTAAASFLLGYAIAYFSL